MMENSSREERKMSKCVISWSELPRELLTAISERLGSRLLLIRFRSVCKSWRASCPLPNQNSILHPRFPYKLYDSINFSACTVYMIERLNPRQPLDEPSSSSSWNGRRDCWIVMVDEFDEGKLSIRYPLSKHKISASSAGCHKGLNLLDFRVTEIAQSYAVNYLDDLNGYYYFNKDLEKVLSLPCSCTGGIDDGRSLLVLECNGILLDWHLGISNILTDGESFRLDDIVHFKGRVYGVDRRGRAYSITYDNEHEITRISTGVDNGTGRRKRLVVSKDCLYLVLQNITLTGLVQFKAYKLDEHYGIWWQVHTLENHVFLVGTDFSCSLPAQAYAGFQGDCIVAFRHSFRPYQGKGYSDRSDIMNLHPDKLTMGIFPLDSGGFYKELKAFPMFWPPPSWLSQDAQCTKAGQATIKRGGEEGIGGTRSEVVRSSSSSYPQESSRVLTIEEIPQCEHAAAPASERKVNDGASKTIDKVFEELESKHPEMLENVVGWKKSAVSPAIVHVYEELEGATSKGLSIEVQAELDEALQTVEKLGANVDFLRKAYEEAKKANASIT